MLPWTNSYCANPDYSATIKCPVKAARPGRSDLEDKLKRTHQILCTLHCISSWIPRGSVCSVAQVPPLYRRCITAMSTEPKPPQIRISRSLDLVGSLHSVLNDGFSCSSIFVAFHTGAKENLKNCSIDPLWKSSATTCSSQHRSKAQGQGRHYPF